MFITDIYSANEVNSYGVSGQSIVDLLEDRSFEHVEFVPKKENVVCKLKNYVANGDIVVTMGAGDIHTVGHDLFTLIKEGELVS